MDALQSEKTFNVWQHWKNDEEEWVMFSEERPWIGGWAIMFALFSLTGASSSLIEEKKAGIFHRLLSGPVKRSDILWSKYILNTVFGFIQIMIMFVFCWLAFKVDIMSNPWNLMLVSLLTSGACTSFGMLVASVTTTQAQAPGLIMSAIGGAWFPVSMLPDHSDFQHVHYCFLGCEHISRSNLVSARH